ncbi:MAG: antitoxin family protein [Verrucomicrobiota bacterium]|nr:antitoxin family protein [Verrucomicrobiota bacterium]
MTTTVEGVYEDGKIVLRQPLPLPDNAQIRVIIEATADDEESAIWQSISENALTQTWDNADDDVFNELLAR